MRVRSQWFKQDHPRSVDEIAGAVAFIAWKIAMESLKKNRQATFEIETGPLYLDFLAEMLIFLAQVADRILHRRYEWNVRVAFVTALARKMADDWAQNRATLLGGDPADQRSSFIQRLNQRSEAYAEHEYREGEDNFALFRALGAFIEPLLPPADRPWIIEQMQLMAPEAVRTLERSMKNLLERAVLVEPNPSPITCPE